MALHLLANGLPVLADGEPDFEELCKGLLDSFRAKARLLGEHRCPADQRIEAFLRRAFCRIESVVDAAASGPVADSGSAWDFAGGIAAGRMGIHFAANW